MKEPIENLIIKKGTQRMDYKIEIKKLALLIICYVFTNCSIVHCQTDIKYYKKYYISVLKNKKKKANKLLVKIQKNEKDDFFFFIKKAELFSSENEFDSAAVYYGKSISLRKTSFSPFLLSNTQESINDVYRKAIVNYGFIINARGKNAIDYCNRGIFNQEIGDYHSALQDYNVSLSKEPHYLTYFDRAICYSELENLELAIRDYDSCLILNSSYGSAYLNRGFCYISLNNFILAEIDLNNAIKYSSSLKDQSFALNNLAYVYLKLGELEKARKNVELSLNLNSSNAYGYRNLALIEIAEGNFAQACIQLLNAQNKGFEKLYGDEVKLLLKQYCD